LPGELVDRIIDHLYNDASSLKATSLVCKTWLPRSRFHLFQGVVCDMAPPTTSVSALVSLLYGCPDVAPYVHKLKLVHID
ncbi:hypothetical protein DICSQDRAFT_52376, partial [Dichomitus squalens LYAD-421 SS1]|uniref:uncharacterized protein n=1 Tax=Dichomitus squalens (strain LYAD-421) TaxID=732165 RepID=UPI000441608D